MHVLNDWGAPIRMLLGIGAFGSVAIVAFIFGIIGIRQPNTRKVYSIWGMILSLPLIFLTIYLLGLILSIIFMLICEWAGVMFHALRII